MRILLASADLDDVAWAAASGFLDGVMTTPPLFREQERDERDQIAEICRAVDVPVYVTVHAVDGDDVYRDGKELARLADHVIVQVPMIEDSVGAMRQRVAAGELAGPFLRDAEQSAAQAYGATATPEVFVIDREGIVRYHGAPDADHDDPAQNAAWTREALDAVLAGRDVDRPTTSPAGCSMKWRVDLLWWAGCPSHGEAAELLQRTLDELGRGDVHVVRREVRTRDEAKELGFVGSPTFSVGRRDLFPTDAPAALTCRVYERPDGRVAPLPDADDLAARLRQALARPWDLPGWVDPRTAS
jgi:hypothetical protein